MHVSACSIVAHGRLGLFIASLFPGRCVVSVFFLFGFCFVVASDASVDVMFQFSRMFSSWRLAFVQAQAM